MNFFFALKVMKSQERKNVLDPTPISLTDHFNEQVFERKPAKKDALINFSCIKCCVPQESEK